MIEWSNVSVGDIAALALIAAKHGMGLSEMLHNMHLLSGDERSQVERIVGKQHD